MKYIEKIYEITKIEISTNLIAMNMGLMEKRIKNQHGLCKTNGTYKENFHPLPCNHITIKF